MAMQLAQAGERVAQCGGADSCPDDPTRVCIPANPPGLPPGPGAPGGGNGSGHCPLIAGGNPCFPTTPGHPAAYAGGPAKAGDPCWGSPGTIGAFIGPKGSETQIYNTTQLINQSNGDYSIIGWIYTDNQGHEFFQNYPGTTVSISAGAIVGISFGGDLSQTITPITSLGSTIFNIATQALKLSTPKGTVNPYTRGCFTRAWDGKSSG